MLDIKGILKSAFAIWFFPTLFSYLGGMIYSGVIGFQTRGDMDAVAAAGAAYGNSIWVDVFVWGLVFVAAYLQGRKLRSTSNPLFYGLIAGAVAILLSQMVWIGVFRDEVSLLGIVVTSVVTLCGVVLGTGIEAASVSPQVGAAD